MCKTDLKFLHDSYICVCKTDLKFLHDSYICVCKTDLKFLHDSYTIVVLVNVCCTSLLLTWSTVTTHSDDGPYMSYP